MSVRTVFAGNSRGWVIPLLATLAVLTAQRALISPVNPGTALAGLLVGTLVGLTGMGSGSLMAPILILLLGTPPVTAVGTDLVYAAVTKLAGGLQHARQGRVDLRVTALLAAGSVPAAVVGVQILEQARRIYPVESVNSTVLHVLGIALLLVAGTLVWGVFRPRKAPADAGAAARPVWQRLTLIGLGAAVGLVVSLTSVGSGAILIAVLSLTNRLPAHRLVGTDVFHGALLTAAAGLAHGLSGNVDPALLLNLLVGSIPGVLLGSRLSGRLPERALRGTLAVVLLATSLKLL